MARAAGQVLKQERDDSCLKIEAITAGELELNGAAFILASVCSKLILLLDEWGVLLISSQNTREPISEFRTVASELMPLLTGKLPQKELVFGLAS